MAAVPVTPRTGAPRRREADSAPGEWTNATTHVPGSNSRSRRPGRRVRRRDALRRGLPRRALRAGVPELRLRAHGRAGDGVLPDRRQGDPAARTGAHARRADRAGPDAAAPGRPLQRPRGRAAYILINSTRSFDELGLGGFARGVQHYRLCSLPATELAVKHVGRAGAERRAARRIRRGHRASSRWRRSSPRSARSSRPRWPRRTSRRRRKPSSSRSRRRTRSMLKQTEGSRAVAEAIALCRPQVICAYPITPQTHIVEALGEMVKTGELAELRVHQRRIRIRRAVGRDRRLRRRACARTRRRQQPGPAVHGRGRLQRRGPRAADRDDDRQPGDRRADQHLERPLRQHVDARRRLDPALRGDQPGGARPPHPGVPPRRGAVVSGDGLHGRLHPDARVRPRRRAEPGGGRPLPAALRAAADPRSDRPRQHRRDGRPGGVHRGALPVAPQAAARARAAAGARGGVQEAVRPRLGRADPHVPHRGCRDDRRRARLRQRHGAGGRRRDARRRLAHRLRVDLLVPAVPARRRCARRCRARSASSSSRNAWRWDSAASCPTACASRCRASCSTATR